MRPNHLREIWKAGRKATNCWLSVPSAASAELLAHQGWDSVTIDMQHGPIDFATAYSMLIAVSTTETVPLVRVPSNEAGIICAVLDSGAYGVMCPTINTKGDCERFVASCRYAPMGKRSMGAGRAHYYAGSDYVEHANDTLLAIAQIETAEGLANMGEIARVPGLDMLFVGPTDLGRSMGRTATADQTDPIVVKAIDSILACAHDSGLRAGIYCRDPDYGLAMMKKGFDLVTVVLDTTLLGAGAALRKRFG